MYIIEGVEAVVTVFNTSTGDWSGETFIKDNPYNDELKELTRKSLIGSLSNMLYMDIDFHHVYIQDDTVSISINEDGDGCPNENGSFLVDYIFRISRVSDINIDDILKEGID